MLNEQVRKLLVACLLTAAIGCGYGRENLDPSSVWGDPTASPAITDGAQAPTSPQGAYAASGWGTSPHQVGYQTAQLQQQPPQQPAAPPPAATPPYAAQPYVAPAAGNPPYVGAPPNTPQLGTYPTANSPPAAQPQNSPVSQITPAPYIQPSTAQAPTAQAPYAQAPYAQAQYTQPPAAQPVQYAPQVVQPTSPYEQQYAPSQSPPRIATLPTSDTPATNSTGQASTLEKFEPARIVAQVGSQYILAGDVLGAVNQMIEPHKDKMSPDVLEQQKEMLVQRMVKQMIDSKLLYNAFLQEVPPDRLEEALGNIRQQAFSQYDETELPKAIFREPLRRNIKAILMRSKIT